MTTKTESPIQAFIAAHGLTMTAAPTTSNPNISDPMGGGSHWLCLLKNGGRSMPVPYSQGSGHRRWKMNARKDARLMSLIPSELADIKPGERVQPIYGRRTIHLDAMREALTEPTPPDLAGVLECLASDASGYDSALDFDDWASNYGFDTDSRKAEQSYRVTGDQSKRLRHLLGDAAYAELLAIEW